MPEIRNAKQSFRTWCCNISKTKATS